MHKIDSIIDTSRQLFLCKLRIRTRCTPLFYTNTYNTKYAANYAINRLKIPTLNGEFACAVPFYMSKINSKSVSQNRSMQTWKQTHIYTHTRTEYIYYTQKNIHIIISHTPYLQNVQNLFNNAYNQIII